jgi:hypothetical protein
MIVLARAGHPEAMRAMDGAYPGRRENPDLKPFTGHWNEEFTVFTPAPPAFWDDPEST